MQKHMDPVPVWTCTAAQGEAGPSDPRTILHPRAVSSHVLSQTRMSHTHIITLHLSQDITVPRQEG